MNQTVQILSKEIALLYLSNEFGNFPLKVTTVLDKNNCWTGKVILETADVKSKKQDFDYLKFIYGE